MFSFSDFIKENAIEVTNKHAPKWETDLPKVQDFILATSYGMLPLLTYEFPTEGPITPEHIEDFKKHQKMAFIAARGFNVAYELIGNLRKADWYNQVITGHHDHLGLIILIKSNSLFVPLQFTFGVPFKHLKLTTTNRFGEYITDKDMTGATQACKDAYKAWCQVKKKKKNEGLTEKLSKKFSDRM